MLTTISETSANCNLTVNQIRWQLTKNNVQPIDTVKWSLNGYLGRPYKVEEVSKALENYNPITNREIVITEEVKPNYTQNEIIQVLRKHPKNNIWNKNIKYWTNSDFEEFKKLT